MLHGKPRISCNGVFGQNNNNGDHRIRCRAQRASGGTKTVRYSDYITVKGTCNTLYILCDTDCINVFTQLHHHLPLT